MRIVIGGGGKVGELLCKDLAAEGHDIILIEIDEQVIDDMIAGADIGALQGNVADYNTQVEAGVEGCDFFISVTANDEVNMIAAVIASKLGAANTIARVRNPEYGQNLGFMRNSLGISLLINPDLEAAREIAKLLKFPNALNVESFANGRLNMVELYIDEDSPLADMKLTEFRAKFGACLVCAAQRGDEVHIPGGNFVLKEGDHILVTGPVGDLDKIYKAAGAFKGKLKNLLLIGGGKTAHYICQKMVPSGMRIRVIEKNHKLAMQLANDFPKINVTIGDGTDYRLLDECNFDRADAVVALTGIDEENVLMGMYAASREIPKIITKVNRTQMLSILRDVGLQTIITPKRLVSDHILRLTRGYDNAQGSNVEALYRLLNDQAEALEFNVRKGSKVTGVPLSNLSIKSEVLIAFILRGQKIIFPKGDDTIEAGDHILVISKEKNFDDVEDILGN